MKQGPFKMKKFSGFGEGTGKKPSPAKLGFLGGLGGNIFGSAPSQTSGGGGSLPPTPVSSGGGTLVGSLNPTPVSSGGGTPPASTPSSIPSSNTSPRGKKNRGGTRKTMRRR